MRILIINCVSGIRSTGRICAEQLEEFLKEGNDARLAYGRMEEVPEQYRQYSVQIGDKLDVLCHVMRTRLLDEHGFGSARATQHFLKWAEAFDPDLLWLHNIHGYYINVELLFQWIKKRLGMKVKWTLHDCWAFTGHCAFFSAVKCMQWKSLCAQCPQLKQYPKCYGKGNVAENYRRKRAAFTGVTNLELVVPSYWLKSLVEVSFLSEYPVKVQYNSINRDVFISTESTLREQYHLEDKFIILGVASAWSNRKGLWYFCKLSELLPLDCVIVLVGLNKKQIKHLPNRILGLRGTNNAQELAGIYSTSNVFVNPSVEESFGMTPLEAEACGTPAIVFKNTACEEIAEQHEQITAVPQNVDALYHEIMKIRETRRVF